MVVWITGLSGSGKTTLCAALRRRLLAAYPKLVTLDGDAVRAAFGGDLGYSETDRLLQIKRIQGVVRLLAEQGLSVLVAALYAHPDLLSWNRTNLPDYFEVYLKADIDFLLGRDNKGLYTGARRGEILNVVGVDIPWHEPREADLVVDARSAGPSEIIAEQVIQALTARTRNRRAGIGMHPA